MSAYDIRAAVKAVIDETDLTSPEEIAAKVAEMVPGRDLRPTLATVLRDFVRIELGRARSGAYQPTAQVPPDRLTNRSAKVSAIRDAAPRWLRERVYTGESGWLLLGDCSYDHLKYLQSERLENAARSAAAADRYGRLADLVKRHKVSRVSDLPRRVLDASDWQEAA